MGDIQQAIDACTTVGGGQVWVAAGTYKPTSEPNPETEGDPARRKHFSLRNGVRVYGGFPATGDPGLSERNPALHETTLSGDQSDPDAVLPDGLPDTATMTDNCYHVFYHPTALGLHAAAVLDGFTIRGGHAGPDLTSFHLGAGGGMFCDAALPTIANCVFKLNSAGYGGGIVYRFSSSPTLANCVLADNSAGISGGGLYNYASAPSLAHCVLAGNSAVTSGGGIENYTSDPTLDNTILWASGANPVAGLSGILNYCIVEYGWSGMGGNNSNANPQFVSLDDPDGPDNRWRTADDGLRLQPGSPGIDTGRNALVPAGVTTDLLGNPRIFNMIVDRGAYEWTPELRLSIRREGPPAPALILFWSAELTDATLDSSPNLAAPWTPLTEGITVAGGMFEYSISLPPAEPRLLFRLRR